MKTSLYLCATLMIMNIGCNESDTTAETYIDSTMTEVTHIDSMTTEPLKAQVSFKLYDRQDNPIEITYDDKIIYCAVATWCGYTKKFIELINDPSYQSVVSKFKFVFLLCRTELPSILNQIKQDETMSETEKYNYRRKLIQIFEEQDVLDPTMLTDLPGEYNFFKAKDFNKEIGGYPNAYSQYADAFTVNPIKLMAQLSPENKNLLDEMYQKYVSDDH